MIKCGVHPTKKASILKFKFGCIRYFLSATVGWPISNFLLAFTTLFLLILKKYRKEYQ